jgi:tetratricopeptide (TPR) repeat protein
MRPLFTVFLLIVVFSCTNKPPDTPSNNLGNLEHQFDISEKAQPAFEKGMLLLHSFEYDDAREAFQEAVVADENEIMSYWGEAMTHYKALWKLQDVDAGRAVMDKLGSSPEARLARITDELERDFWIGVELLYGDGELIERNQGYAEHMATLYDKYPGNQEVAAFYALGLMWSVPLGRDAEVFDRSAQVVAGILQENPNHPGALHYMIHAYDDPEYAQLAIKAANLYAEVAPDATHALHMPSHIYLALGMWDDVVASNEASYQASVNRLERKGLGDAARGYHSYFWLQYGYLQQERYQDAHKLLKDMVEYTRKAPTKQARGYWISMQNAYLTDAGEWSTDIDPIVVGRHDLGLISQAGHRYFQGRMAHRNGDSQTIISHMDSLDNEIKAAELLVTSDGITLCSAGVTRYAPNRTDIQRAMVMWHQMDAMRAELAGNQQHVEQALLEATTLEAATGYSFGPPDVPYPSFEHFGYWLLDQDRPDEALEQFNTSLERMPNRTLALRGKKLALKELGQNEAQPL